MLPAIFIGLLTVQPAKLAAGWKLFRLVRYSLTRNDEAREACTYGLLYSTSTFLRNLLINLFSAVKSGYRLTVPYLASTETL